ncbi:MAG: bacterial regulatory helix-turn-helix s, AraC family protein, partial [Rhodoferax sp.]|nr:bacterial regulatory helix-turn-helix s, AraC family protein [Rhodoferax sp.]
MATDPLSDILKLEYAETVVTGGFSAAGRWAIRFPPPDKIKFCAIVKGGCWIKLDGEAAPVWAATGDILLLAASHGFVMCSDADTAPVDAMALFLRTAGNMMRLGDAIETRPADQDDFVQMGGHVRLDPANGGLLADVLPRWIHIQAAAPEATPLRWLLAQLVGERASELPGAGIASVHLAQLMFVQILRAHLQASWPLAPGWLRAVSDPRLAPALRLMHAEPGRPWQLEELARAAAMSRTTFAQHFKTAAGVAPLTYLTQWRMRVAQRALREEGTAVSVLAGQLGYTSESAFSNAF